MNTTPSSPQRDRALVLGGGGSSGNAWLLGVVAGLLDAGLDVTEADLIVGTSAGATTAAQITSASPTQLCADTVAAAPPPPRTRPAGFGGERGPTSPVVNHLERTSRIIAASENAADMRRRMGAAAIELATASDPARQSHWRATVAARLPSQAWPERPLLITAVDAETGEPVDFGRDSGVELVDAVAASTSGGPAYRIGERWYIDGGYRSVECADVAAGYGRVLVLSPFGGATRHPLEWGTHLAAQADALRAGGSRVETVGPEGGTEHMFGANSMDYSLRPLVARTGFDQGRKLAERLTDFWR